MSKRKLRRDAFSVLARAVGAFMKKQGWVVFVVGDPRVQHIPGALANNHEFIVNITVVKRVKDGVESK